MNKVVLTGRIAQDIELKTTTSGVSVCTFNLAVKRPKAKDDTTDFFTVVCWRNTAEFVSRYFRKGNGIEVAGMLTVRKWQDKNGNNRYATEIVADEVDFGKSSSKNGDGNDDNTASTTYAQQPSGQDFAELPDDDDLPF